MASKAQKKKAKKAFAHTRIVFKPTPMQVVNEKKIIHASIIEESEPILADDYPVSWNYVYLVDGIPRRSDVAGTVATLKKDLRMFLGIEANEVRRCDLSKRGLL